VNWFGECRSVTRSSKNWNALTIKFKVRGAKRCDDRFIFRVMLKHKSKRLRGIDRMIDSYIGRKIGVFKSFINSHTFLWIESLWEGGYVSAKLTDNSGITYQSLGQEINRIRGSMREQRRKRSLLADW